MPDALAALARFSLTWPQDRARSWDIQVCLCCQQALWRQCLALAVPRASARWEDDAPAHCMGFRVTIGPREACELHPFLHAPEEGR